MQAAGGAWQRKLFGMGGGAYAPPPPPMGGAAATIMGGGGGRAGVGRRAAHRVLGERTPDPGCPVLPSHRDTRGGRGARRGGGGHNQSLTDNPLAQPVAKRPGL